ncbi:MAG: hypothetical protein ACR2HQ_00075 [Ilumatobacteraceae bacterium]
MTRRNPPAPRVNMSVTEADSDWDTPARITQLADGRPISAPVIATFSPVEPTPGYPTIELVVDVHDGRIVVTRASLIGSADRPLDSNAVRNYSLPILAAMAVRPVVLKETEPGRFSRDSSPAAWESVVSAVRQRQTVDRPRLEDVARDYLAAGGGSDGITAVEERHQRSRSQAYRLVKAARARGLISSPTEKQGS